MTIGGSNIVPNGLVELIAVQRNLKYLNIYDHTHCEDLTEIIPSLTKHSNNIIKLKINKLSLDKFPNLQELEISYGHTSYKKLQHVTFPSLQTFKFQSASLEYELLTKFLENNGKNLKEIYFRYVYDRSINLAMAKFCPNLKSFYTTFYDDEVETLKAILNNCQQLESIETWCGEFHLNEVKLLEILAKYSPKEFYKLRIHFSDTEYSRIPLEIFPKELEPVFICWANRIPQKPLSLIIVSDPIYIRVNEVIEKFKKLGVIGNFEIAHDYKLKYSDWNRH